MAEAAQANRQERAAVALRRGRDLWQQACADQAEAPLQSACLAEEELTAAQAAEAWCLLGLVQRQQGRPREAGHAFLRALRRQEDCQLALRSLYFQRYEDDDLRALLPDLDRLVRGGTAPRSRAQVVLADWHHRVGDRTLAQRFFRSLIGEEDGAGPEAGDRRPDALLIGAPKCGTTSLMAYLKSHPGVWCQPRKELHFFNNRWTWGMEWYEDQFPARRAGRPRVRLEGTPDYLQDPAIPARVSSTLPGVKLIVLLREPLARALSWYHHQRRWGGLVGSAEQVIARELQELTALPEAELRGLGWRAPNCLAGSLYDIHIASWRLHFQRSDLLLVRSEQLFSDPRSTLAAVLSFLDLDPRELPDESSCPALNQAPDPYPPLAPWLAQHCRQTLLRQAHAIWSRL